MWRRYALALLSVALAAALSTALWEVVRPIPFYFFIVAVIVNAWRDGLRSALVAGVAGALVVEYGFMVRDGTFALALADLARLALFVALAALVGVLAEERNRALRSEARLRRWYEAALASVDDAVIVTDAAGRVICVNGVAEALTGWPSEEAEGRVLGEIFPVMDGRTGEPLEDPGGKALRRSTIALPTGHTVLIARDGRATPVEERAVPFRGHSGRIAGAIVVFRDVTEHQRAEEARTRLDALVESSEDAIVSQAIDGRIMSWNAGAARLFGYAAEEAIGQPVALIVPPERADELVQIGARLSRGEPTLHLDTVRVRRDGRRFECSVSVFPLKDADGRPLGAALFAHEITARKQMEQALREGEQRFRQLAETIPHLVWTAEPDGALDYFNERSFDYTGMSFEQLLGWGWEPVIHPADLTSCLERWRHSLRTGETFATEYRLRRASDGVFRWHLGRAQAVRDTRGRLVKWFGTCTDIDDRKRAEEAAQFLSEAGAALASSLDYEATLGSVARLAVAQIADGCVIDLIEPDGAFRRLAAVHADPAKEELLRTLDRRYPTSPHDSHGPRVVARTGRSELVSELTDAMLAAGARDAEHARLMIELAPRSYVCAPLAARGKVVGALSLIAAGSSRRFNPSDLALVEDLGRRAALAIYNARLYREAEGANRAKDQFLAVLSHELPTPLTPVLVSVSAMLDDREVPREFHGFLEMTRRSIEMEARLIDDLLDVTRISQGKLRLNRHVVDAHALVRQAVAICRDEIGDHRLRLELDLAAAGHQVEADPARLQQIFWNLIKNAVKFTPPGGLLAIRSWNESQAGDGGRERLLVAVRDSGIGIAPEVLPKIFDAFEQGEASVTRQFGGLGLGLAVSRSLAEAHGGRLTAASAGRDQGATFTLELTTVPAPAAELDGVPCAPPSATEAVPLRILLAEDNEESLRVLARLLRRRGYAVATADSVASALAEAERAPFDLLVSDIGLPDGSGLDLIRTLRARGPVPGIALSGFGMEDDLRRSLDAGFLAHLTKPIDFGTLETTIRQVTQNRQETRD
ncbi:MAG: PAS domain S-box protein [Isosphaeraceae bacterium]|nr:PAS domain S-box protein [Isosphaeraceae bacterium]